MLWDRQPGLELLSRSSPGGWLCRLVVLRNLPLGLLRELRDHRPEVVDHSLEEVDHSPVEVVHNPVGVDRNLVEVGCILGVEGCKLVD